MKHIGIYTNKLFNEYPKELFILIHLLITNNKVIYICEDLHKKLNTKQEILPYKENIIPYKNLNKIKNHLDLLITIGGDGTFLEGIHNIHKVSIPVLGINSGRLGFLANINITETEKAIKKILQGKFQIETRTMIELSGEHIFEDNNIALNEFTIHKLDTSSMISIELYINNQHVNTYLADGLIISTPTGSTAYSLSAGGPIVHPSSNSLIITPIAVHNLNVRPLIIPDNFSVSLKVTGRSEHCMIALDYRSKAVPINTSFLINKHKNCVHLLNVHPYNYFSTLKNKLLWGADKRN
jgi:NAD+ kinase